MLNGKDSGDGKIGRFRKVDILFVVAVVVIAVGAARGDVAMVMAGSGLIVIPITQRGDKP
jgi:hypothetical protein